MRKVILIGLFPFALVAYLMRIVGEAMDDALDELRKAIQEID